MVEMLSEQECKTTWGAEIVTGATLLTYLALAAGAAAILKLLTSSRGKVRIPGIDISWGN
ncbi:MAG: hypothetical protein ACRDBX_00370 [Erysipelotrichaceae bacterium]